MKRIITIIALLGCTAAINIAHAGDNKSQDYVMLKNGKVTISKDGKTTELKKAILTEDGKMLSPDGSITMADGTMQRMKEGEKVVFTPAPAAPAAPSK